MTFLAPERLLLLIAVLAVAGIYVGFLARRKRYAVRFTNLDLLDSIAPNRPGWRRHLAAGLVGLSAIALVIGIAQPTIERTVATESAVVVLAIDTSISMNATDVTPTRMQAAIGEAITFVDELPNTVEVGLVAFDRTATVLAPPTSDHDAVTAAIAGLTTARGTAGGDAIDAAVQTINATLAEPAEVQALAAAAVVPDPTSEDTDEPAATIVLLSDGATTSGLPIGDAAALAADSNLAVSTITYGTDAGTIDVDGQTVPVPPDTASMTAVAEATGGTAFTATDADQLRSVYEQLEARVATTTEQQELTVEFTSVALALLLTASAAAFIWTGRFL